MRKLGSTSEYVIPQTNKLSEMYAFKYKLEQELEKRKNIARMKKELEEYNEHYQSPSELSTIKELENEEKILAEELERCKKRQEEEKEREREAKKIQEKEEKKEKEAQKIAETKLKLEKNNEKEKNSAEWEEVKAKLDLLTCGELKDDVDSEFAADEVRTALRERKQIQLAKTQKHLKKHEKMARTAKQKKESKMLKEENKKKKKEYEAALKEKKKKEREEKKKNRLEQAAIKRNAAKERKEQERNNGDFLNDEGDDPDDDSDDDTDENSTVIGNNPSVGDDDDDGGNRDSDDDDDDGGSGDGDENNRYIYCGKFIYYPPNVAETNPDFVAWKITQFNDGWVPKPYRTLAEFIEIEPQTNNQNPPQIVIKISWEDWLEPFKSYTRFNTYTHAENELERLSPFQNDPITVKICVKTPNSINKDRRLLRFSNDSGWAIDDYDIPDNVEFLTEDGEPDPALNHHDPDKEEDEENEVSLYVARSPSYKGKYLSYILNRLIESNVLQNPWREDNFEELETTLLNLVSDDVSDEELALTPRRNMGSYKRDSSGTLYELLDSLRKLNLGMSERLHEKFAYLISQFIIEYHTKAKYHKLGMSWESTSVPKDPCIYDIFDNFITSCDDPFIPLRKTELMNNMERIWNLCKKEYIRDCKIHNNMNNNQEQENENGPQSQVNSIKKRNWMLEIVKNLENYIDKHFQKIVISEVDIFDKENLGAATSLYTIIRDAKEYMMEIEKTKQYIKDCNLIGPNGTRQRFINAVFRLEECFVHKSQSIDEVMAPTYTYDDTYNYALQLANWVHCILNEGGYDIRIGTIHFGILAGKMKRNSIWKCINDTNDINSDEGFYDGFGIFLSHLKRDFQMGDSDKYKLEYLDESNNFQSQISRIVKIDYSGQTNVMNNVQTVKNMQKLDLNYYLINVESWLAMFRDGVKKGMEYTFIENFIRECLIDNGEQNIEERVNEEMKYIDYRIIYNKHKRNHLDSLNGTTYQYANRKNIYFRDRARYDFIKDALRMALDNSRFFDNRWYNTDIEKLDEQIEKVQDHIFSGLRMGLLVRDNQIELESLQLQKQLFNRYINLTPATLFPNNTQLRKIFEESRQDEKLKSLIMGCDQNFEINDETVLVLISKLIQYNADPETKSKYNRILQGTIAGYLDHQSAEIHKLIVNHNKNNEDNYISPYLSVSRFFQKHLTNPKEVYDMLKNPIWKRTAFSLLKFQIMKILWSFDNVINGIMDCIEYFFNERKDTELIHDTYELWNVLQEEEDRTETHVYQLYTRLLQKNPKNMKLIKSTFFPETNDNTGILTVHSGDYRNFKVRKVGVPDENGNILPITCGEQLYYSCQIVESPPGNATSTNRPIHVLCNCLDNPPDEEGDESIDFSNSEFNRFNHAHRVRLGSWNVACANNLEKPTTWSQYMTKIKNIVTVICESRCDIVALQELPNEVNLKDIGQRKSIKEIKQDLIDYLDRETQSRWAMQHSSVFHSNSSLSYDDLREGGRRINGPKEVYAFIYDQSRIEFNHANQDETNRVEDTRARSDRFSRLPIISNFTCNKLEFTLCTVHLPPYDKKEKTSQEIKDLSEKVFPELIKVYGNKKSNSVIFLGDFNMCYTRKKGFNPKPEADTWDTFSNAGYIPCITSCTNVLQTQRFDNIWVHNSFEKLRIATDYESGYNGVVKVNEIMGRPIITGSALKEGFKKEVSDHNLVYVDFRVDEVMPWSTSNIVIRN